MKQATLIRRSTVLSFPLQLVFPAFFSQSSTHIQVPVQPSQTAMHSGSLADVGCQVPLAEWMKLRPVGQRISCTGSNEAGSD
jgi:hypothetical protein